jgi:hypothetical protein
MSISSRPCNAPNKTPHLQLVERASHENRKADNALFSISRVVLLAIEYIVSLNAAARLAIMTDECSICTCSERSAWHSAVCLPGGKVTPFSRGTASALSPRSPRVCLFPSRSNGGLLLNPMLIVVVALIISLDSGQTSKTAFTSARESFSTFAATVDNSDRRSTTRKPQRHTLDCRCVFLVEKESGKKKKVENVLVFV